MAETLGSLVDKLSIIDLKLWHCQELLFNKSKEQNEEESAKLKNKNVSLLGQRQRMITEIDDFFEKVIGDPESVVINNPQNKIYGRYRNE